MNYKTKRMKSKLSTYTVAKELGIEWKKYQDVEKKKINLEGEYLDKFLKVIEPKNAKMINFNRKQRMSEIRNFIKEGKLRELMLKRNYNIMVLARTLGYEPNVVAQIINGSYQSEDTIEYVYDFLQNPINTYVDGEEVKVEESEDKEKKDRYDISEEDKNLLEEINKLKKEKNLGCVAISKGTGIPASTISHSLNGRSTSKNKLKKIYDFLLNYIEEEQPLNEYESILKENKINKMQIAKNLDVNYSYVYNFFKGAKINKKIEKKIIDYINNLKKNEEVVEEYIPEEFIEDVIEVDEKIIPEATLDETQDIDVLKESDAEEIFDEDSDEFLDEDINEIIDEKNNSYKESIISQNIKLLEENMKLKNQLHSLEILIKVIERMMQ